MSRVPSPSTTTDLPRPNPRSVVVITVVAIVALAFNLRTPVTSLGALLSDIRADLGFGSAVAGLLTSMPTIVFGAAGATVPLLSRRLGNNLTVWLALLLLAVGTAGRSVGATAGLLVGTLLAMAGIAVVNVLLPVIVRTSFPRRQGWLTGVYVSVMQVGAAVAVAAAVPIAANSGWGAGLAWWAVPVALALLAWWPASRVLRTDDDVTDRADPSGSRLTWTIMLRDRTARALMILFGVQSMSFYTIAGWLPTVLRDLGFSAEAAGSLNGIAMGVLVPAALLMPAWVAQLDDQRWFLTAIGLTWVVGFGGLLLAPMTLTAVWMVAIGISMTSFPVALLLMGMRTTSSADTRALSAFAQGFGYLLALPGPLLFGIVHDVTGGWTVPIAVLLVALAPIVWFGWIAAGPVVVEAP